MTRAAAAAENRAKHVQAVDRTLAILETLAAHKKPMPLSVLAREVGLNVSTVHRLLHTLMGRGFVQQEAESGRYKLGLKIFELGTAALSALDVRQAGRPYLEEIVRTCNETANLVVLDQEEAVYVDQVESSRQVKMIAKIGGRAPLYCTGAGKAILASLPPAERERILDRITLQRRTARTIVNLEDLRRELAEVLRRGYSLDLEEMEDGVRCVAAPVWNSFGRVVAAISVSGPSSRLNDEYLEAKLIPTVRSAALQLSRRLGFAGER
ncbi:MAG: IclR family transcriptional regulator [Bacillota bacterium]|nr:IclR family transcriptional regulator [Bacillota bacterium]